MLRKDQRSIPIGIKFIAEFQLLKKFPEGASGQKHTVIQIKIEIKGEIRTFISRVSTEIIEGKISLEKIEDAMDRIKNFRRVINFG